MTEGAALVDRLLDHDIVTPSGTDLRVTDAFRDAVDRERGALDDGGVADALDELSAALDDERYAEAFAVLDRPDEFVAVYRALADRLSGADPGDTLVGAALLTTFGDDTVPEEGAPDTFLPVGGDALTVLLPATERSIVYVWREDCEPCDSLVRKLDELFADDPPAISRFAIYGPNWSRTLRKRYDVVVGPTILFMVGDTVDARIVGDRPIESIRSEVRALIDS